MNKFCSNFFLTGTISAFLLFLVLPDLCVAQTSDEGAATRIQEHYKKGKEFYDAGEYQKALEEFNKAKAINASSQEIDIVEMKETQELLRIQEAPLEPEKVMPDSIEAQTSFKNVVDIEREIRQTEKALAEVQDTLKRLDPRLKYTRKKIEGLSNKLSGLSASTDNKAEKKKKALEDDINRLQKKYTDDFYTRKECNEKKTILITKLDNLNQLKSIAYCNIGIEYALTGDSHKAIDEYKNAIRTYPEDPDPHYNLAVEYMRQEEYEDAAKEFEFVSQLEPENSAVYYNLATLYDDYLEDSKKAVSYYKKYLSQSPDLPIEEIDQINKWIEENSN